MWRRAIIVTAFAVLAAPHVSAQVGYPPTRSPYRDLRETQEITFFTGYYRAKRDRADVAPKSGPLVGTHYQWRAGGPANLTFAVGRVASERRVLDPEVSCATPPDCKSIGDFRWPVYLIDGGLAMALTGARSFFHLVPEFKSGIGIATDFHSKADVGDFAFGTRFAFTWGAGLRWVPGNRYQLRADFLNHLYSIRYPQSYYLAADDGSVILQQSRSRTQWLNNPSLTFGISYLFSR
jgi:hypothetical protein